MNTTFLFGAGAEIDYGMPSGQAFIKALICNEHFDTKKKILGENVSKYRLLYSQSTSFFTDTVTQRCEIDEKKRKSETKALFSNPKFENDTLYEILISDDYKKKLEVCSSLYGLFKLEIEKSKKDDDNNQKDCLTWTFEDKTKIKDFYFKYGVFYSSLDSRFNDLRNEVLLPKGKAVISAYTTIFLEMLYKLYPGVSINSWSDVFDLLIKPYQIDKKSYYDLLREKKLQNIFLGTTNYTDFIFKSFTDKNECESKYSNSVAFLHGKMNWFEDRKNLCVYDIKKEQEKAQAITNKDFIFPFIFIPSGVKPIVCEKQIKEYGKFIDSLNNSKILCIVGYRFNSEDNHVNSIINEWINSEDERHLVIFNYKESDNNISMEIQDINWLNEDFTASKQTIKSKPKDWDVITKKRITEIIIDKDSKEILFESFLRYLKKQEIQIL